MKYEKIGLILGGGGVKGAYQYGAMLALEKHKLLQNVCAVSATSIGAVNLLLLTGGHLKEGIDLWKRIGKDDILPKRKLTKIITGFRNFGFYSREGLISLIEKQVDLEKVSNSLIKAYVCATPQKGKAKYFQLNNASKENIINYVLASSAIPYVYEPVTINNIKYVDGGTSENEPYAPLLNEDIDLYILIPLNDRYKVPDQLKRKAPLIDLGSDIFSNLSFREGINVDSSTAQTRMEKGYRYTDKLLTQLKKDGFFNKNKKEKEKTSEYFEHHKLK